MPELSPSWQLSVSTAAVLIVIAMVCHQAQHTRQTQRRTPKRDRLLTTVAAFAREFALVMLLLAVWQGIGATVHTQLSGAMERGRAIDHWQHAVGWPSETVVQGWLLPHPWLVKAVDVYYAYAHLNGMAIFLIFMWWRHRDVYPRVRATVVATTLTCFLVQLVPVAPPRLLPDLGFVDTAVHYGQSVYGSLSTGVSNQLSAMPSVHVGWAVIVGWYVWWSAGRRWRWIGPLHTAVTVLVVVGSANHWWLDGVVAAGIVALALMAGHRLMATPRAQRVTDTREDVTHV